MPRLSARRLGLAAFSSLALSITITACENVAGYSQPTLVRVIDASYAAPSINLQVENLLLATNIGLGSITPYGTLSPSSAAGIDITAAASGVSLVDTTATLLAGWHSSILLCDNTANPGTYQLSVLDDQQIAAPAGQASFRFLNQAIKTGAVDIYMLPAGATLANAIPLTSGLQVDALPAYTSFAAQTVTMVITPAGLTKPAYTYPTLVLTGGEVRTVLIVNSQLTSNPPITAYIANDVN